MSIPVHYLLLAGAAVLLPLAPAHAQTPRKPAARPVPKAAPAPRAAAKPAPRPGPAPTGRVAPAPVPAAPARLSPPPPAAGIGAADASVFNVGTNAVNVGIGLGNRYGYGSGFLGGSVSVSPALSVAYERGILELGPGVLGVGAFVGYQGASYDLGGGDKWKFTDLIVTLRGAFHYPLVPKLDTYGGLSLGMRRLSTSFSGPSGSLYNALGVKASASEAALNLFVGGRYFFTPGIGAFAELGYDQTYLKIGLTAKF